MLKINRHAVVATPDSVFNTFLDKAEEHKTNRLGSGAFACTVSHPDPALVVKVCKMTGQFGRKGSNPVETDGYMQWMRNIAEYPTRFAPRIYRVDVLQDPSNLRNGGVTLITMERLIANGDDSVREHAHAMAQSIDPRLEYVTELDVSYKRLKRSENKDSYNLGMALDKTWSSSRKDLHAGNWMVRRYKDGSVCPVITDPAV